MTKVFPGYEQLPLLILSYLRKRVLQKTHLLDVGCGTGTTLTEFASLQPEWSFTGVDPAAIMLENAHNKISAIGAENRVKLLHGTVDTLPDEPRFDAATCILVEHLQPDNGAKLHLLEGIHRRILHKMHLRHGLNLRHCRDCQKLFRTTCATVQQLKTFSSPKSESKRCSRKQGL